MVIKKRYTKAQIEFLMLLHKRFTIDDGLKWSDFNKFFSNDGTATLKILELREFYNKTDKKYFLKPEKERVVKELIKEYYEKEIQPHHNQVLNYIKKFCILILIIIVTGFFILYLSYLSKDRISDFDIDISNVYFSVAYVKPCNYNGTINNITNQTLCNKFPFYYRIFSNINKTN